MSACEKMATLRNSAFASASSGHRVAKSTKFIDFGRANDT